MFTEPRIPEPLAGGTVPSWDVGVALLDASGTILSANSGLAQLMGTSPQSLTGHAIALCIGDELDGFARQAVEIAILKKEPYAERVSLRTQSGPVLTELHLAPLPAASASAPQFALSCRVVPSRSGDEGKLALQRRVFSQLTADLPLAKVLEAIARCYEAEFPESLCSILLIEAGRLVPGAAPSIPDAYSAALEGIPIGPKVGSCGTAAHYKKLVLVSDIRHDPLWENYRELPEKYGLRACWSTPIRSSTNQVLGTFAIYYTVPRSPTPHEIEGLCDAATFASIIMERHRLVQGIRESNTRLRALVENLSGMAYRCRNDTNWTMLYVSDGCEQLTGYKAAELEGNSVVAFGDLVHPEDRDAIWEKCQTALSDRVTCRNQYRILTRSGEIRWVAEQASGTYAADGTLEYINGYIQDITEELLKDQEREQLQKKMLEAQKLESLGVLAGGIAHDFNNILMGVLGNVSLLKSECEAGGRVNDRLVEIEQAASQAGELCNQMLAYSGKGKFVVSKLDLAAKVEDVIRILKYSLNKKTSLILNAPCGKFFVEGDSVQIGQVILNLVINASEALQGGQGSVEIELLPLNLHAESPALMAGDAALPPGGYVCLSVKDDGCGISGEVLDRIFQPFYTTKFTGRGLGLAAVQGIVRGHRGRLEVASTPDRGSVFRVILPVLDQNPSPMPGRVAPAGPLQGWGKILVVDDELVVRKVLGQMLAKMGYDTDCAGDGVEAIEAINRVPTAYRLVIMDLTMPRMGGYEACDKLREQGCVIPIVFMSGYNADEPTYETGGEPKTSGFLHKPFSFPQLQALLESVLQSGNPGR